MHRSATRRDDSRSTAHGALPPGKVTALAQARSGAPAGDGPPAVDAMQRLGRPYKSSKASEKKSRPLISSTNNGGDDLSARTSLNSVMAVSSERGQRRMGRSPTPGPPDENDDWVGDQQAPPLPSVTDRSHTRSRTTSAGGSRNRVKSEEKKPRLSFSQDDVNGQDRQDDQGPLRTTREASADNYTSRTRSESTSQGKTKPLKRRISWGRNKKDTEELPQQELNYKKASQLGLPELEKELVPSLRDTIHRMTGDHRTSNDGTRYSSHEETVLQPYADPSHTFSSSLSPPTTYERATSRLSLRSTLPMPMESTPMKSRHQSRSPRAESSHKPDAFNRESIVRPKYSRTNSAENDETLTKATRNPEVSEPKPKSILKSSLKTPRPVNKYQNLSPNLDADDSASEPALRTPRVRSSSRSRDSPLLSVSTSPARTSSNIPSPKLRSRSSSSARRADKLPSLSQPSGHKSPRTPSSSRSPIPSADQVETSSYAPRSAHFSGRVKAVAKLPLSKSPAVDSEDGEGTPKASRVAWDRENEITTETDSSADEKIRIVSRQSPSRPPSRSTPARPSPKPDYDFGRSNRHSPVPRREKSVIVMAEQTASDISEHEVVQSDKASEDSHVRRRNELVDLVAGLNLDLGPQNDGCVPTSGYMNASYTGRVNMRTDISQNQSICSTRQDAVGGSNATVGFEDNLKRSNETVSSSGHQKHGSTPREWLEGSPSRHSSSLKRLSATPDMANLTVNATQANGLLKPDWGNVNRDSLLMLNADRQREAFGIPPSISDVRKGGEILSSAESNTSMRNPTLDSEWEGEATDGLGLSHGAEKLFHTLGIGAGVHHGDNQSAKRNRTSWRSSMAEAENYIAGAMRPAPATLSACSSSSSIYEDDVPDRPWQKRERDLDRVQSVSGSSIKSSWKKTLSHSAYVSLLERHGEAEMRRQEVIWELCETEQAFLKSLRTVLKVFVHPLLGKNRTWVSGLPSNVSRLLDWLDDIFQLHAQISSALQHARSSQYPVVLRIAETFRTFIPRLEVYQPYIVRLDEVVDEIEKMTRDHGNELGEFFRIQSSSEECAGMSFSSFLWLPLTRLGRYLKHFNELWSLTPRSHVDHLPTFSLLHSATTVVRVMREVKLREEEYAFVKTLVSRIQGLPDSMQLMQRERRLIAHGALQRVHLSEHSKDMLEGNSSASTSHIGRGANRKHEVHFERPRRSVAQRRRANSLDSCLSDAASMTSVSSAASNSSLNDEIVSHYGFRGHKGCNGNAVTYAGRFDKKGQDTEVHREKMRMTQLYAFIFTDLALFTTILPHHSNDGKSQDTLELLDDIGICRVLTVADHSGNFGYDHLVGLHVLPMDIEQLDNGVLSGASATSLFIHLPNSQSSGSQHADARKRWWDAFEQCYHFTLRSLSFPAHSGRYLAHGPALDQDENTRQTVMAILASGLPLPKSPSVQILELEKNGAGDATSKEREERGWWALRFQQTLRDMQRDDMPPPSLQRTSSLPSSSGRKTLSGRRRLKLGSEKK